jgi:hypothetical protein
MSFEAALIGTRPDRRIAQMQALVSQAKVVDDVKDLQWLLNIAELVLLRDDKVDIHICVNEIALVR